MTQLPPPPQGPGAPPTPPEESPASPPPPPDGPAPTPPREHAAPTTPVSGAPGGSHRGVVIAVIVVVLVLAGAGAGAAAFLLTRPSHTPTAVSPPPKAKPTLTASPTASATPGGGVAYTDPSHYYTARFDGAPSYRTTEQSSATGQVPYMFAEYAAQGTDQIVGVLLFPSGTGFDGQKGLQGIADSSGGTVVSSAPSSFQGYPSLEGVIAVSGDYLKVQLVHVGDLAYIMGTAGSVNPPSDYTRFLSTVHITPH